MAEQPEVLVYKGRGLLRNLRKLTTHSIYHASDIKYIKCKQREDTF